MEKRLILTGRAGNIILAHIVNESPASAGLFLLAIHREKWHYNKSFCNEAEKKSPSGASTPKGACSFILPSFFYEAEQEK